MLKIYPCVPVVCTIAIATATGCDPVVMEVDCRLEVANEEERTIGLTPYVRDDCFPQHIMHRGELVTARLDDRKEDTPKRFWLTGALPADLHAGRLSARLEERGHVVRLSIPALPRFGEPRHEVLLVVEVPDDIAETRCRWELPPLIREGQ